MKIMISGIGGVGGYVAGCLCDAYPGQVTLIARRKRLESIKNTGIVIHSHIWGEHILHPAVTDTPAEAGIQDLILICTKVFSLKDALQALLPCIDEHTVVIPIMNGIDHAAIARAAIPAGKGQIMNAMIRIQSGYNDDYSIPQTSQYAHIFLGKSPATLMEKVLAILDAPAGLTCTIPDDFDATIWKKYIINCAYNTITGYYRTNTGGLRPYPQRLDEFRRLLYEVYDVAIAYGIHLPSGTPTMIFNEFIYKLGNASTSSMARDAKAGRYLEIDTFSGHLIALANAKNVPVPMMKRFHAALEKFNQSLPQKG